MVDDLSIYQFHCSDKTCVMMIMKKQFYFLDRTFVMGMPNVIKCENVSDSDGGSDDDYDGDGDGDGDGDNNGERAVLMIWLRFVRAAAAQGQLLVQRVMVQPSRQRCLMVQFIPPRCNGSHHLQM